MSEAKPNKTDAAFEKYCDDAVVQQALEMSKGAIALSLLRDCFMSGAKYATERCKAEHHVPKANGSAADGLLAFARQVANLTEYKIDETDAVSASDGEDAMESLNNLIERARDVVGKAENRS